MDGADMKLGDMWILGLCKKVKKNDANCEAAASPADLTVAMEYQVYYIKNHTN